MIFEKKYKVSQKDCDPYDRLTLRNLSAMMVDTSFDQAKIIEKDIDMKDYRWIVYSWDIEILEPIEAGRKLTIKTWPSFMRKFYAYREFEVLANDRLVARARAVLMLIDIKRLRPIKIPQDLEKAYGEGNKSFETSSLTYKKDLELKGEIAIRLADIDRNFHVNNAVYFDLIKELTGVYDKDIRAISLIYRNEIRDKKKVLGYMKKDGSEIDLALKNMAGDRVYCFGKIRTYV